MCFVCRHGFIDNLQLGGPTPIGARKAPLSEKYLSMMQEVALNEQVCSHSGYLLLSADHNCCILPILTPAAGSLVLFLSESRICLLLTW